MYGSSGTSGVASPERSEFIPRAFMPSVVVRGVRSRGMVGSAVSAASQAVS